MGGLLFSVVGPHKMQDSVYNEVVRRFRAQKLTKDGFRPLRMVSYEPVDKTRKYHLWLPSRLLYEASKGPESLYLHEFIFPDEQCILYMDCERDLPADECPTDEEVAAYVMDVHTRVKSVLLQYDYEIGSALHFSDSRAGKFSVHISWRSVGFETPRHCLALVQALGLGEHKGISIDVGVYPCGEKPRYLRMPYCKKRGVETRGLIPPEGPEFNEMLFFEGLVTYHSGLCPASKYLVPMPKLVPIVLPDQQVSRPLARVCSSDISAVAMASVVIEWLGLVYPDSTYTRLVVDEEKGVFSFRVSWWCKYAKRVHRSNGMVVENNARGQVELRCLDPECMVRYPLGFSVDQVMVSKVPLEIDFSLLPQTKKMRPVD